APQRTLPENRAGGAKVLRRRASGSAGQCKVSLVTVSRATVAVEGPSKVSWAPFTASTAAKPCAVLKPLGAASALAGVRPTRTLLAASLAIAVCPRMPTSAATDQIKRVFKGISPSASGKSIHGD